MKMKTKTIYETALEVLNENNLVEASSKVDLNKIAEILGYGGVDYPEASFNKRYGPKGFDAGIDYSTFKSHAMAYQKWKTGLQKKADKLQADLTSDKAMYKLHVAVKKEAGGSSSYDWQVFKI